MIKQFDTIYFGFFPEQKKKKNHIIILLGFTDCTRYKHDAGCFKGNDKVDQSKLWKFTKIYITTLETSRFSLADAINIIAQVQNAVKLVKAY